MAAGKAAESLAKGTVNRAAAATTRGSGKKKKK
jgi:hypothetical protein